MKRITILTVLLFLLSPVVAPGQTYSGERKFDGKHKNEIAGNLVGGYNVVTGVIVGETGLYTRHFTDRWSLTAGQQVQFIKWLYSFDVMGTYRLPLKRTSIYFDVHILDNIYGRWGTNEFIANGSACWEANYVDFRFGLSFIHYSKYNVKGEYQFFTDKGYTEPPTFIFGLGVNIRPRSNPWNLGFFIRNYDQFYYENWNINWGIRAHAPLTDDMKIFSEFNIRPAGSISQLATRYETSLKVGVKYVW